jgi:phage shock protein A
MADGAARRGDTAKATEYNQTAQAFANRLIATEKRVEDLKTMHLQAAQAADQARAAVAQNASLLQQKLAERQKLLSQLDQTRMQQQLNTAMASLSQTVDQDVPTFDDVRAKIEAQYAKALGTAELSGQSVEARMLEVEQAGVNSEAQMRLEQMRQQMGLPAGDQGALAQLPASSRQALVGDSQPAAALGPPAQAEGTGPAPASHTEG